MSQIYMNANFSRLGIVLATLVAAAALATMVAAPATAQDLYKSTRPDGSVVYSDKPAVDAVSVEKVDQSRVIIESVPAEAGRSATQSGASGRSAALSKADAEVQAARAALARAIQMQKDGEAPLPGERTGIASKGKSKGKTRLNDAYADRQKILQDEVDNAQKRLDIAYQQRNAVKD